MDNHHHHLMFPLLLISLLSFTLLFFSLYARQLRRRHRHSPSLITDIVRTINTADDDRITNACSNPNTSLLLEIWPALLEDNESIATKNNETKTAAEDECEKKRKKKKRGKKKNEDVKKDEVIVKETENRDLVSLYPFTSSSSATQRRIKQQYDQLVKSHESNGLTLIQVYVLLSVRLCLYAICL